MTTAAEKKAAADAKAKAAAEAKSRAEAAAAAKVQDAAATAANRPAPQVAKAATPLIPGREAAQFTVQYGALPKYSLTEKAYIGDILYDPEQPVHPVTHRARVVDQETGDLAPLVIEYEGIPGPHMIPVNDAARAMAKAHPKAMTGNLNPVDALTTMGAGAVVLKAHDAKA